MLNHFLSIGLSLSWYSISYKTFCFGRCASKTECVQSWNGTSDRPECTGYDPSRYIADAFSCSFCCTTPLCNQNIVPRDLYTPWRLYTLTKIKDSKHRNICFVYGMIIIIFCLNILFDVFNQCIIQFDFLSSRFPGACVVIVRYRPSLLQGPPVI